ncbi:hypothetical protein Q1695_006029 [Nippostrongylus brasiliensis]|nr:hypothetical protein Q1695_012016 [Nippostrongylus brasiliensis]WKY05489.1 hypothetical protein Q1695_006029 [Nippostrongylus brasiliensis]
MSAHSAARALSQCSACLRVCDGCAVSPPPVVDDQLAALEVSGKVAPSLKPPSAVTFVIIAVLRSSASSTRSERIPDFQPAVWATRIPKNRQFIVVVPAH